MSKCKVMNKHIVSEIKMEDEANDRSFGEKTSQILLTPYLHTIITLIAYPLYEKKMQL